MTKITEIEKAIKFRDDEIKALRELADSLFDNIDLLRETNKKLLEALQNCAECMNEYKDDMIPISNHKAFWLFLKQAKQTIKEEI